VTEAWDALVAGLRANDCTVAGPMGAGAARAEVLRRATGAVAWNADVPLVAPEGVLRPDDAAWMTGLPDADSGVTGARLAVAEPAALVLAAAPGSPRATSLVPPVHVCVVRIADVVPTIEAALAVLAAEPLPSAVTWIGGPSRTGDLEMILTLGVHGPRAVHVVLLDDGG
jgi:L-lactate dehydrogenase complex protein LldG